MKNYNTLLNNVRKRSNPLNTTNLKAAFEGIGMPYNELSEYVKLAMVGVPEEYTKKSIATANNVIEHLKRSHGSEVRFKFQGSVPANTHVLSEHDVDVVQISTASYGIPVARAREIASAYTGITTIEQNNVKKHIENFYPYSGSPVNDLYILRVKAENALTNAYQRVDISGAKAICVNVQNPIRNVDVVTAQEYYGVQYLKSNNPNAIGIRVYDKNLHILMPEEYPFLSVEKINERGTETNDRFKKIIRFLKNIKIDAKDIIGRKPSVSSFDIYAICYDIPIYKYNTLSYMQLLPIIHEQLLKIVTDENYRNNLKSVDGQEFIFRNSPEKIDEIKTLLIVFESVITDARTLKLVN